jgi:hypothetical protein
MRESAREGPRLRDVVFLVMIGVMLVVGLSCTTKLLLKRTQ